MTVRMRTRSEEAGPQIRGCDRAGPSTGHPALTGAKLAQDLAIPAEDLAAACTYLVGEDLITVDWTAGNTPAMVTLTHQGIRCMEAEEEERS
ncbi:hypothetical protein [Streptomyces sp. DB-54]